MAPRKDSTDIKSLVLELTDEMLANATPEELLEIEQLLLQQEEADKHDWDAHALPYQRLPHNIDDCPWVSREYGAGKAGNNDFNCVAWICGRGCGKALDVNTPIFTPSGWKKLGDIQTGDKVFGADGKPCNVVQAHTPYVADKCYMMRFDDGTIITADADHLWLTETKANRKNAGRAKKRIQTPTVKNTQDIFDTLYYPRRDGKRELNHSIVNCAPIEHPEANLPIHPYILGFWLGDGTSQSGSLTIGDDDAPEQLEILRSLGLEVQKLKAPFVHGTNGLSKELRLLGLKNNKHVPVSYLRASADQRLALLQGLMDSDGTVDNLGRCEFTNKRYDLAYSVFELLIGLGQKPQLTTKRSMLNGVDYGTAYRVAVSPTINIFRLPRKAARLRVRNNKRLYRRYIEDMLPVEPTLVRCLTVDSDDRLYLASQSMVPTHNTHAAINNIQKLVEAGKYSKIGIVSTTEKVYRESIALPLEALSPSWCKARYRSNESKIIWTNKAGQIVATAILLSAMDPKSIRSHNFDCLYLDEVIAYQYPECYALARACLRVGDKPLTIVATTPMSTPLIWQIINSPNTAVINASTYDNTTLSPEAIAALTEPYLGHPNYQQEIMGKIHEAINGALWTPDILDAARIQKIPDGVQLTRVIVAVDPGGFSTSAHEVSDETGIIVAGVGTDKNYYVLADCSISGTPNESAHAMAHAYNSKYYNDEYSIDALVVEVNMGGEYIKSMLSTVDSRITPKTVVARDSKRIRAEPISALYVRDGRGHLPQVYHVGNYDKLEKQMREWIPGKGKSPDRLDALIYALTELHNKTRKITFY